MLKRIFEGQPPHITFFRDFRQVVHGDLTPGQSVKIYYDAERLPRERSWINGATAWSIEGYARFHDGDEALPIHLHSRTGVILDHSPDQSGAGTTLFAQIDIPDDADALTLWFVNTGASGQTFYDSANGANYVFRFTPQDIHVHSAEIVSDPTKPYSEFNITVYAAPHLEQVSVMLQQLNVGKGEPFVRATDLVLAGKSDDGAWNVWSLFHQVVPYGAVVAFYLHYVVEGRAFTDDNHSRGYLASPPEPGDAKTP